MRRLLPYLPPILIGSLAVYPVINSLPAIIDGPNHFYRLATLVWHIQHGDLYPRWFADLHYGFGAPVLNFYSPLSYYVATFPALIGAPLNWSYAFGYYVAFIVLAVGLFQWMRELKLATFSSYLVVAGYLFAPHLYMNTIVRGAYPENWGLALMPWLFWSATKLSQQVTRAHWFTFTLICTALILTHNLMAFILTPLVALYFLFRHKKIFSRSLFFALTSASLLCLFYILPILIESPLISLNRAIILKDFSFSFTNFNGLFLLPIHFDPYRIGNTLQHTFALPIVMMILIGGLIHYLRRPSVAAASSTETIDRNLSLAILHLSLFVAITLFTLHAAEPLWNVLPFMRYIQTPKRLLGPASIFLATLAGIIFSPAETRAPKSTLWLINLGIISYFIFSLPWTYHLPYKAYPATVKPFALLQYENQSQQIGTTLDREYVPRTVAEFPAVELMLSRYQTSDFPSHLAPLTAGVTCETISVTITTEEVKCTSNQPFTVQFYRFYFVNWHALVDGTEIAITIGQPLGNITLANLPTGSHTIKIFTQATLPQTIGLVISLLTGLTLLMIYWRWDKSSNHESPESPSALDFHPSAIIYFSLLLISLFLIRIFYLDRYETPFRYTELYSLPNATSVNFGDHLELIGFTTPATTISSGGTLDFTLYWRGLNLPIEEDYSISVQLVDRSGNRFGQSDTEHPDLMPTSHWRENEYAHDVHQLRLLNGTPPGTYRLLVQAHKNGVPLNLIHEDTPNGVEYELGTVSVTHGATQPSGKLRLIEASIAQRELNSGDPLKFTLVWNSGENFPRDLKSTLVLIGQKEQPIFQKELALAGVDFPASQWIPNETIRYPHAIPLPPDLSGGTAKVRITLSGGVQFDLGEITIKVPPRTFDIPPMQSKVDYVFKDSIRLLGYDRRANSITLYWQSVNYIDHPLTIFVHQLDANNKYVIGHDAAPTRATTSWITGEVITTTHPIHVDERWQIGWYDSQTGERFAPPLIITP